MPAGPCSQFGDVHDHLLRCRMAVIHTIRTARTAGQGQKSGIRWVQTGPDSRRKTGPSGPMPE
ncbi:hypothetical protein CBI38_30165 [Rhodococcus oxybenzonivorans]|uniref:Uncharacterized protein n=1 Tax=Rhodococcus oxybenzonivorans TaxID=1990687 RepID=A0A2S2C319_9NOCA|nr:hypothetical protein CBI38_30165 [Rhodococcus oxybenzonivorans]QHE72477.1 hypothetical protein GFS60_06118 [Rhodococcus sp. WAY2]